MKITVCFKIVPDYDRVAAADWKLSVIGRPNLLTAKKIIGVFDEGALETALALADRLRECGERAELTALTCGKCGRVFAEAIYSAGFDEVVSLKGAGDPFSPDITANSLSGYIREHGADLILCGEMAGPADTGTVPYRLGAKLGLPVLDRVSALGYGKESGLTAERETETASETYERLPRLVCVVSSAKRPNLRMALYRDKVAARGRKVLKARAGRKGRYTSATLRRPVKAGRKAERLEGDPRAAAVRIAELAGREAEA